MPEVFKCPLGGWLITVPPGIGWFDFEDALREYFGRDWLINQAGFGRMYMRRRNSGAV